MNGLRQEGPEQVTFLEAPATEPALGAELRPCRLGCGTAPSKAAARSRLRPLYYEGPHTWAQFGQLYGTCEYGIVVQEATITQHVRILCVGFGAPRNLAAAAAPIYAAEEPPTTAAPGAPREAPTMKPPMVQTPPELAAGASSGETAFTQTVLRMYERQSSELAQFRQAEASRELVQFRAEVSRDLGLMRADVTKIAEAMAVFGKQLAGVVEAIANRGKALEISSVEQAADTISRFEAMAPRLLRNGGAPAATPAKDEEAEDEGENVLGQILAAVQAVSGAVRDASAAMQAIAPLVQNLTGGAAPTAGTRPNGRVQRPVNGHAGGNSHAGAPEPDASS